MSDDLQVALESMRAAWGASVELHPARGLIFVLPPGEPRRMYREADVLAHWQKLRMMALGLSLDSVGLRVFWDALPEYQREAMN